MICKTRCPADTNTNDVEKTCIKNPNKIHGHWQYYKSYVYHTYQNIQTIDNFTSHAHVLK